MVLVTMHHQYSEQILVLAVNLRVVVMDNKIIQQDKLITQVAVTMEVKMHKLTQVQVVQVMAMEQVVQVVLVSY